LVIGGGPAGICASVSAARMGMQVIMIERYGAVGGNLTLGNVSPVLGRTSKGTMYYEVIDMLSENHKDEEKVETRNGKEIHIDAEEAKGILINFLYKNNVEVMLQSALVDVIKEDNTVKGVLVTTPMGFKAIYAERIIDATGDDLAAYLAGCTYKVGRDSDGLTQPLTFEFTINNVDESRAIM